jgi:threonine/homoserine/homoserine lactone efflux protein
MKKIIPFYLVFLLAGCSKFRNSDTSVWAEGAFLVPTVLGILGAIFLYQYFFPGKNKVRNKLWLAGVALMVVLIGVAIWYFNSNHWR